MSIPKIIHQMWKTSDIPYDVYNRRWVDSWKKYNPDWEYRFWTDDDLRNLVKDKFPWFLDIYDSYPHDICRSDSSRYFILHEYGGLYVDLDFECLKNFDDLLDHQFVLGSQLRYKEFKRKNLPIPNALMMSIPGHNVFNIIFKNMSKLMTEGNYDIGNLSLSDVHDVTGSNLLCYSVWYYNFLSRMKKGDHTITVFPHYYFYPIFDIKYRKVNKIDRDCSMYLSKNSYAVTYWTGIWVK